MMMLDGNVNWKMDDVMDLFNKLGEKGRYHPSSIIVSVTLVVVIVVIIIVVIILLLLLLLLS